MENLENFLISYSGYNLYEVYMANIWPIIIISFLFLGAMIYLKNDDVEIADLNIFKEGARPKVKKKDYGLEIQNVRSDFLVKSYWRDKLEVFENLYSKRFIDVRIDRPRLRRPRVKLYYDLLPDLVSPDESPTLKPMESWIGKNQFGKDVVVDLQSTPAIYIDGRPGSGKSISLMALLEGYISPFSEPVEVIIVTSKPADFFHLKNRGDVELKLIDPFETESLEHFDKILSELNEIKKIEHTFKEYIKENSDFSPSDLKLERLRQKGHLVDIKRKFFIFDEAKDYLSKNKADGKELGQKKQELVSAVYTHIRRTARFLSIPIVVASQTQSEADLDIPLKMFHLRLASSTNEAMSRIICGDKRLTCPSFTKGKFFLKTDKEEHILRVPLIE